ncbi:MAG: YfcE family phosphodiesterase [Acholeplasmatales bacterium]|nr:YfcE family phosphodiesterase [Acholeplasmatales bacterium]
MRNLLIISDTHRDKDLMVELIKKYKGYKVIHCGDYCIDRALLKKYDITFVDGNCDAYDDNLEHLIEVDNKKLFITHGHTYRVKMGYMNLYYRAIELSCDYVFFGHTHEACIFSDNGIIFVNPGSLKYGRTYAVVEDGKAMIKEI